MAKRPRNPASGSTASSPAARASLSAPGDVTTRSAGADDRVGLDLDLPAGVEEPTGNDHRACRPDVAEDLAVDAADDLPVVAGRQERSCPNDVAQGRAGLGECRLDDLEAAPRLDRGIGGARSVGPHLSR